jgi:ribosomal protein S18 acetylase RimI-like enzyme
MCEGIPGAFLEKVMPGVGNRVVVSAVKIRRMTIVDYDACADIWLAGGLPYKPKGRDSRERIANELTQPSSIFLVAEIEGDVVGVVLGTHDGRKVWGNRLGVHRDYRRMGIGSALLAELERIGDGMGLLVCAALVENDNEPSKQMLAKRGYVGHDELRYYVKKRTNDS